MKHRFVVNLIVALFMSTLVSAAPPDSAVADAARKGDRDAVRALLQQGADVNAPHGDGMSALHWAAERGDAELAQMLVYAGANVAAVTRIGAYTPLHLAARSGSAVTVKTLIAAGANVKATTTTSNVTPLHLAAAAGSPDVVTVLLENGADPNAREGQWDQTPLVFAASLNRVEAVKTLLARGADPNLATKSLDLQKQSQLDRAAAQRQRQILESFRAGGQEPTASQVQAAIQASRELFASGKIPPPPANAAAAPGGRGGDAPAGAAAAAAPGGAPGGAPAPGDLPRNFDPDEGPPPAVAAKGAMTPLLHAVRQGHFDTVKALVEGGADINKTGAGDSTSPLLMAVINGQFDTAMYLIEKGANPNLASNPNGITPLWAAVNTQWQPRTRYPQPQELELQKHTYLDVMDALLNAGADPDARIKIHPWYMVYTGCGNGNCGLADTAGSTAFWRAAYATDVDAMRLLVKHNANPGIPTLAPQRRGGGGRGGRGGPPGGGPPGGAPGADGADRPAAPAPPAGAPQGGPPQAGAPPAGGPPQGGGGFGGPPQPDLSGLPPAVPGGPGVYPLHAAAGVGYGEGFAGNAHRHAPDAWLAAVKFMIEELGADVNARDHNGYTALHHAAARGDNEMILYLVSQGADITLVSRRGQTVADMANGPVQRVSPIPATVALAMKLGSKNSNKCLTC